MGQRTEGGATALWRRWRRYRRLEEDLASALAGQRELRRRLEIFEAIAKAAGATLPEASWWAEAVPDAPMPANLLAAAAGYRGPDSASFDHTVLLDVEGADVFAVIGGPGDPREWWSAVWQLTVPEAAS